MYFTQLALYSVGSSAVMLSLVAVVELLGPSLVPGVLREALSAVLNAYLYRKYTIKSLDGTRDLPSCPYHWPNGQGDAGKFLSGIENSATWKKQYGNVYRIWAGMKPEVVLTQPHQLSFVFADSDKHVKAAANDSGAYMDRLLGRCVGLISGDEWRSVRAVVGSSFSYQASSVRAARIGEQVREHFDHLDARGRLGEGILHPAEDMKMLPFWVVCECFYGRLPEYLLQELVQLVPLREDIFRYVVRGGITRFSWARWLPLLANAKFNTFQRRWKAFNDAAHAHATAHAPSAPIVRLYDAVRAGEITEDQLLQTLDESLYANLDVTTGGLSWNLVFLAANPAEQNRLRAEAQRAVSEGGLETYVRGDGTFLAACVLESSRLKPLAAFSVPQAAPTARDVDGYIVPAGTNFIVDTYALNVNADTWAPDNTTYRPERFMARRGSELRYRFWRFGFGPRQCMGKYVADVTIRMTLVHLVLGYELEWLGKEDWTRNGESWITHPDFELRCSKRTG